MRAEDKPRCSLTIENEADPLIFGIRVSFAGLGRRQGMIGTILIVILILALFGALPRWSHSRNWGYAPTGGLGLILVIVVILLVLGRI